MFTDDNFTLCVILYLNRSTLNQDVFYLLRENLLLCFYIISCSCEIVIYSMDVSLAAYVGVLSLFIELHLV